MEKLVAALWRLGRLIHWPKHSHGQRERHDKRHGNIEVLTHSGGNVQTSAQKGKHGLWLVVLALQKKIKFDKVFGGFDKLNIWVLLSNNTQNISYWLYK